MAPTPITGLRGELHDKNILKNVGSLEHAPWEISFFTAAH